MAGERSPEKRVLEPSLWQAELAWCKLLVPGSGSREVQDSKQARIMNLDERFVMLSFRDLRNPGAESQLVH